MYDNIGGKIKGLAKAGFIVEAIVAVITGIALMASDDDLIIVGVLVLLLGPIVAWVSSWLLYGFGEIIDKTCSIERNTRGGERKSEAQSKIDSERINKIEKLRSQGLRFESPIIILSFAALVLRIISSISYFVNYNYVGYGEYEMNIAFPSFVSLISLIIALAPIVLFLIYILKFHESFKATILVPIVFGLSAFIRYII
jgi:hypothetical protein